MILISQITLICRHITRMRAIVTSDPYLIQMFGRADNLITLCSKNIKFFIENIKENKRQKFKLCHRNIRVIFTSTQTK